MRSGGGSIGSGRVIKIKAGITDEIKDLCWGGRMPERVGGDRFHVRSTGGVKMSECLEGFCIGVG
jgi:hypothetical protein